MGWVEDPSLLAVLEEVRFGPVPASAQSSREALLDALDLVPEHHGESRASNPTIFRRYGLTDSPDAYAWFNPRDFIPASVTRYGHRAMADKFVGWAAHERTKLALARCPDCIDGIVTLAGVPGSWRHDFFKIFEVRFVTDLAVDATNREDRMKPSGDGRLFVSRPLKVLAAIDASATPLQHISQTFWPFHSAEHEGIDLRYRGEIGDHLYNLVMSGDASIRNPTYTGSVALLIRYAEDNEAPLDEVCPRGVVPPGTDPLSICNVLQWRTWRCGPYGPSSRQALQVCKLIDGDFRWLTDSYRDCSACRVDPLEGCTE